jgi:hypothetical protein
MAAGGSPYVVEWQIDEEEGQRADPLGWKSNTIVLASRENLERLSAPRLTRVIRERRNEHANKRD